MAIEDANFSGYGFCVNHSNNTTWIERRDNKKPTIISPIININPLQDIWYQFEFLMYKDGKFKLSIVDEKGEQKIKLNSFVDNKYLFFTQVAVHGGFPYYVDDIIIMNF